MTKKIMSFMLVAVMLVTALTGVTAYAKTTYSLPEAVECEHGTVTFSKKSATAGDKVTLTAQSDMWYELGALVLDGEVVLGTGADKTTNDYNENFYKYTFKMPARDITSSDVAAYFDRMFCLDVSGIHDFNGGITGVSSAKSKVLFDGIVNTATVSNSADMTSDTADDLILDAGEGSLFILDKIIAYSDTAATVKPHLQVQLADEIGAFASAQTTVFETGGARDSSYTATDSTGDAIRQSFTAHDDPHGRYMKIKYQDKSVKLSEIKIYVKSTALSADSSFADNMTLKAGEPNEIYGFCYGMDEYEDVYFHLINETTDKIIKTQSANFKDQTEWSIMLDPVYDTENTYTLLAVFGEERWIYIQGIRFIDSTPQIAVGEAAYADNIITVPVTALAEKVSETVRLYAAEYDGQDLIGVGAVKKTVTGDDTITMGYTRKKSDSELKLFVWNDKLRPYCEEQNLGGSASE